MTAPGLLDQLVGLLPARAPDATKAVTGPGYWTSLTNPSLSVFQRDPARMARQAQDVYLTNRHIRQAERLIAGRFATVDWHLEDADGNRVGRDDGDNDDAAYLAVLDLLERPYRPQPGDPIAAVPKTRAALWNLTCRHTGLAGYGAWYLDETDALAGTPRSLLYINPARLSPATDKGGALVGWVLDRDSPSGGTPLDTENVVVFHLEPPDTGHLGAGLVETAMSMVELTKHADRHATGVLAAGGRLSGVVAPKGTETMEEEVYQQLVLDFRRASEDPASARRMNILRGPVEFHRLSATPSELDLVAVMNMGRDEVRELWNVPRSQVGGKGEGGLNSGESKGYDEAVLWQNAVGPRLRSFAETVQYELLDRWAELGVSVRLVIEEPEFDDETPLYERASKAVTLPLTNKERREQVGLEPFNDERDDEVWMASTMTRVYPEPEAPPAGPMDDGPDDDDPLVEPDDPLLDDPEAQALLDEDDDAEAKAAGVEGGAGAPAFIFGRRNVNYRPAAAGGSQGARGTVENLRGKLRDRLGRKPTDAEVQDAARRQILRAARGKVLLAMMRANGGRTPSRAAFKREMARWREGNLEKAMAGINRRLGTTGSGYDGPTMTAAERRRRERATLADAADTARRRGLVGKAWDEGEALDAMKASMDDVRARGRSAMQRDVLSVLRAYGAQVAQRARERFDHLTRKPTDVDALLSVERMERDLLAVLTPHLRAVAEGTGGSVAQRFGKAELRDAVLERLLRSAGVRIKGISETTRDRVRDVVAKGIADGLSAAELGDRLEAASGLFDELRAETIARTETATVLNEAAVAQYREFGVDRVLVYDGDEDEACASADGQTWTVEQAEANPIAHPNCTRGFSPLVGGAA